MSNLAKDMIILYGVFIGGFIIGAIIAGIIFNKLDKEDEE